ncbi:MAG: TraR/DksA C4-type zinc finger protein [Desulfovibrionales bacterium]
MVTQSEMAELRQTLKKRRNDLFASRKRLQKSWEENHETEVEFEERAQKEQLSQGIDMLDAQEKQEIENIDMALHRIEADTYGLCESCGESISFKRLKAVPWTTLCIDCATEREQPMPREEVGNESEYLVEREGEFAENLEETILDKVQSDGRVDTQELDITYKDGRVFLKGALPNRREHHILLEIVEDIMDLHNVVDNVSINPALWEREDRSPGVDRPSGKSKDEVLLEGEDMEEDTYQSIKEGESLSPADELVPENED